MGGQFL
ncbi:hypothetical protein BVRB_023230, partial [Beta vulgaris subsp. vulgaris]